ncbi:hypothetical protein ACHAPT_008330 [Fusarium lateritium]
MRLLNAKTFQLEQFYDQDIPLYAILSHTWTGDEVTFQEFPTLSRDDPRLAKTVRCCSQALLDSLTYVWVDTFCIDKASSAELSEAINSMYKWYSDSRVCYVYLSDVHPEDDDDGGPGRAFRESRWFTRGWTLQELLAPSLIEFFDSSWRSIGLKCASLGVPEDVFLMFVRQFKPFKDDLSVIISEITNIPTEFLQRKAGMTVSVAQKMSWAAGRKTTRSEDMAYSLFGIFGINMPLLYGEGGRRAFIRLQEGIISQTHDHSIFSWGLDLWPTHPGIFATSPADFARCGHVVPSHARPGAPRSHYTVTNLGVQIQIPVLTVRNGAQYGIFNVLLPTMTRQVLAIPLCRARDAAGDEDILTRGSCSMPFFLPEAWLRKATMRQLYLSNKAPAMGNSKRGFTIFTSEELIDAGYRPTELHPHTKCTKVGAYSLHFAPWEPGEEQWALIGYASHIHPAFHLKADFGDKSGVCLLKLAAEGDTLFTELESSARHTGYTTRGCAWKKSIYLDSLGYLSVKTTMAQAAVSHSSSLRISRSDPTLT